MAKVRAAKVAGIALVPSQVSAVRVCTVIGRAAEIVAFVENDNSSVRIVVIIQCWFTDAQASSHHLEGLIAIRHLKGIVRCHLKESASLCIVQEQIRSRWVQAFMKHL